MALMTLVRRMSWSELYLRLQGKQAALVLQQNDGLTSELTHKGPVVVGLAGVLDAIAIQNLGGSLCALLGVLEHLTSAFLDSSGRDLTALNAELRSETSEA